MNGVDLPIVVGLGTEGSSPGDLAHLQQIGLVSDPASALSFLQAGTQPPQIDEPLFAIHRGNQRRLSLFSQPGLATSAVEGSTPAAPAGGQDSQPLSALMPLVGALLGVVKDPKVQQMFGQLLTPGGLSAAMKALLALPDLAVPVSGLLNQLGSSVYHATLNEPDQKTGEVSTNELQQILAQKTATVFDGRTRLEYAIGHIPGAISVAPKPGTPMSLYVSDVAEIGRVVGGKSEPVVVYCNGPFCGKSRRLGEELVNAGFSNVRRYQLGTPVWRALVGMMEIELVGIRYVLEGDRTAAFIDARSPEDFAAGSLSVARNVPVTDVIVAKDDGRLPMDDFNTRVVVFGDNGAQAYSAAEALVHNGFNNVKFYAGTFQTLLMGLHSAGIV